MCVRVGRQRGPSTERREGGGAGERRRLETGRGRRRNVRWSGGGDGERRRGRRGWRAEPQLGTRVEEPQHTRGVLRKGGKRARGRDKTVRRDCEEGHGGGLGRDDSRKRSGKGKRHASERTDREFNVVVGEDRDADAVVSLATALNGVDVLCRKEPFEVLRGREEAEPRQAVAHEMIIERTRQIKAEQRQARRGRTKRATERRRRSTAHRGSPPSISCP